MTAKDNSSVYFEDASVKRTRKLYKVKLEQEETTVFLREEIVDSIVTAANEDENLIAILIAYIDFIRRDIAKDIFDIPPRIDDEIIIGGITLLLKVYAIEDLIARVKAMKWHQIVKIFESESPILEMQEL